MNPGTKLGPYEVLSSLGAGGMGEVYRARDTKLNRDVALKVLPEILANDPERMARFKREAQVLASLNHPNIATIHGFEESEGVRALVMELVEGHTLAERIAGMHPRTPGSSAAGKPKSAGPGDIVLGSRLPIDEALAISKQIAEALEYAHDRGIVHRDLKPANIKISPDGTSKVLDFGLAKALEADPANTSGVSTSPTLTAMATQAGVIIGTAAYMSPEQARGKSVDRRADIWSFGCVLYEMFSGQRLFEGETVTDVLAAVVRAEPDWNALPAEMPRRISELIRRCLTKDPRQRLRDIGEARITIEKAISGADAEIHPTVTPTATLASAPHQSSLRRALPWGVAVAAIIAVVVLGAIHFGGSTAPERTIRSTISPPEGATFASSGTFGGGAVISPDGTRLVAPARDATGKYSLWVRQLDSLTMQKLEGTESGRYPFWSPDSRFVGFFLEAKLKKIDVTGGPPQSVCDAPSGRGGTWSKSDTIVFSPDLYVGLASVPAAGGASTPILAPDKAAHQTSLRWPAFLPDGRHFLYWGGEPGSSATAETNGIHVASLDGKDSRFLFKSDSDAIYSSPGYLLFLREQSLMAQPFDTANLKLTGNAFPVAEQIANPESFQLGFFSVSQNGILVYQTGGAAKRQVLLLDRSGKQLDQIGTSNSSVYLKLSPDGRRLAETLIDEQANKNGDLWLIDLSRGVQSRFTFDPKDEDSPAFSPDGSRIVFASNRNGHYDLYVKDASGAGTEQPLLTSEDDKYPSGWSRDGKFIAFTQLNTKGKRSADLWILPLAGDKKPFPFLQTDFNEGLGMFSPDGHWLAYQSNESGRPEIYVAPFNGNESAAAGVSGVQGGKWQVSQAGGSIPAWSRDGKSLYFLAPDNKLMQADINPRGSAVEVGVAKEVFQAIFANAGPGARTYDVAPDGKRFYILGTKESAPAPITLVANWTAGMKK